MVSCASIIITILISILLRNQHAISTLSKSESDGAPTSDICLICGKHRSEFDIKTKKSDDDKSAEATGSTSGGWIDHISKEHNIFAYFYYIIYVMDKPEDECDGIELFVKKSVQANDISFIPINRALSLDGYE